MGLLLHQSGIVLIGKVIENKLLYFPNGNFTTSGKETAVESVSSFVDKYQRIVDI